MNILNNKAVANVREASPKRRPAAPVNSPPPPNFLETRRAVKKTLLLCLFLFCILAIPVQSQSATATPVAPTQQPNPTMLADCGLPAASSSFTSASSITTFNMTADCDYDRWSGVFPNAIMHFFSGRFTINGNGHTISGPPHTGFFYAAGANTVLNLNNIAFSSSGTANFPPISLINGATLNGQNLIFRETRNPAVRSTLWVNGAGGTRVNLRNVQFLNNIQTNTGTNAASVITAYGGATVTITNGIFRGNQNGIETSTSVSQTSVIGSIGSGTSVTLNGCMTFDSNVQADGSTAAIDAAELTGSGVAGTVNDRRTGLCPAEGFVFPQFPPKKPKKTATPWPSATARPLATTCIDLHQATGIVVHATYGLASGVQCQRLDGGGIGVQAIVDGGFIDAVDIWGYVEQGVEVCFPQAGELLFLDARTMPRAIAPLASTVVNGMTCGAVETPGSIVLMPPS